MDKTNLKKTRQLGMPFGTANARLRKMILFKLVQKTGEDTCFHCGKPIQIIEELSIEHKKPWLDEDTALFWDLDNIAFSHIRCNVRAGRRPHKIEWPEGQAWCWDCKTMKNLKEFPPCKARKRTQRCTICNNAERLAWREKTGRR